LRASGGVEENREQDGRQTCGAGRHGAAPLDPFVEARLGTGRRRVGAGVRGPYGRRNHSASAATITGARLT